MNINDAKNSNLEFTKSNEDCCYLFNNVLTATYCFEDLSSLDTRTWLITITLNEKYAFEDSKSVYLAICRFLSGYFFPNDKKNRPALTLHKETGGERFGKLHNLTPHWHGFLILSQKDMNEQVVSKDMEAKLSSYLEQNVQGIRDVQLDKYEIGKKSYLDTFGYTLKAGKMRRKDTSNTATLDQTPTILFPYDLDMEDNPKKTKKLSARVNKVIDKYSVNPSRCFSRAYCERYPEEIMRLGHTKSKKKPNSTYIQGGLSANNAEVRYNINNEKSNKMQLDLTFSNSSNTSNIHSFQELTQPKLLIEPLWNKNFGVWPIFNNVTNFHHVEQWGHWLEKEWVNQSKSDPKQALYWAMHQIYGFTVAMARKGFIEKIHNSCVNRLPNIYHQQRNQFAVVCLLITLCSQNSFSRYRRHRISTVLQLALKHKISSEHLIDWIEANGGSERLRRV